MPPRSRSTSGTIRARRLQQQATIHRSEAATFRGQLNGQSDGADKPSAAAPNPETPRLDFDFSPSTKDMS